MSPNDAIKRDLMEKQMSETRLSIRVDETLKKQAEEIFQKLGMNMSTAINIFLRSVVRCGGIPFELHVPNMKTQTAMKEINEMIRQDKARFNSTEHEFKDIDNKN
jgi:DNA-damage-inducible protein J